MIFSDNNIYDTIFDRSGKLITEYEKLFNNLIISYINKNMLNYI